MILTLFFGGFVDGWPFRFLVLLAWIRFRLVRTVALWLQPINSFHMVVHSADQGMYVPLRFAVLEV